MKHELFDKLSISSDFIFMSKILRINITLLWRKTSKWSETNARPRPGLEQFERDRLNVRIQWWCVPLNEEALFQ